MEDIQTEENWERARWIWLPEEKVNQYAFFQVEFTAALGEGSICISADSDYVLFLNGRRVAFDQYDDFPACKAYDRVKVLLKEGVNRLLVLCYYQGEGSFQYIPGAAGVRFILRDSEKKALCVSDENTLCRENTHYESGAIEKITGQMGFGFHYDATRELPPWTKARTVESRRDTRMYPRPVRPVKLLCPAGNKLIAQGAVRMGQGNTAAEKMQYAYLSARAKEQVLDGKELLPQTDADGAYMILDLGRETAGLLELDVTVQADTQMYLGYGEHLEDLRVRTYVGQRNFAFPIRLKKGRNHFIHYFKRLGGRYLEVFFLKGSAGAQLHLLTLRPVLYPLSYQAAFHSSDPLLNRIWRVSARTLRLCMHEHYEDTPWREQSLYAMDSRNQALCGYLAFGEREFPQAYLNLFAQNQRADGLFQICAPAQEYFTIPCFSLSWVESLRDEVLYTGNLEQARTLYPVLCRVMDAFEKWIVNGLIVMPGTCEYWNFYEWRDGLEDQAGCGMARGTERKVHADAPLNLFYALALEAQAEVEQWLGYYEKAEKTREKMDTLCQSIYDAFYDKEAGAFVTRLDGKKHYAELTQALGLLTGVLHGHEADALRERLAKGNSFVPISLSRSVHKFDALLQDEKYRESVLRQVEKTWGDMLYAGATSFWETDAGAADFDLAGSLCHGWSAVPLYVIARLYGVQPTAPGFSSFVYHPWDKMKGKLCIPTPKGEMRIEDGVLHCPQGLTCENLSELQ